MKEAIWLVLCVLLTAFVVSGCSKGTGIVESEYHTQDVCPNILTIGDTRADCGYFYLVDKNTGVVYLGYEGNRRRALTVMLNADGKPITAEQLGIEY